MVTSFATEQAAEGWISKHKHRVVEGGGSIYKRWRKK
jgi:hypothetical protein